MSLDEFVTPDPIAIPEGRTRIVFRLRESGLKDILDNGWKPEWFIYFRKPSEDCAMNCTSATCQMKIQPMRKIAYCPYKNNTISHASTTLWECSVCKKQFISG